MFAHTTSRGSGNEVPPFEYALGSPVYGSRKVESVESRYTEGREKQQKGLTIYWIYTRMGLMFLKNVAQDTCTGSSW